MNKKTVFKAFGMLMTGVLFFALYSAAALPSAHAANEKKPTVTSHTYKNIKALKYPQVSNVSTKSLQNKINKDFKHYIEQSYKDYVKNKKDGQQHGYQTDYQTSFEVKYRTGQKLSILTSNYVYSGGAHGNTAVRSFNYDLVSKKRVYLTDILNTKSKMDKTKTYIYNYIQKHRDIFFPDVKKKDIVLGKNTAFYYTKDGIAIVFQQYDVAPYAAGNPVVTVPKTVYQ
ncbi:DUF3298 and DUF4163 domain-containing protein [Bacillus haynesii]|uniref:DUF3298 and DUF4163 domain-containing protein n=1 Tax=Bacillus haynesii TaxID=1925021 RepID=UPI00227E08A2|nr:DUF3298 and DUF4163 domain-containing protein [Bacillus haynesii]MCY7837202.1 DUF3298 and DUF4163 domain-containing protein [Bacillus haynesii]MCY8542865.1 DUF3298 and DUF4163 domain-containing protein [Bacillus haynesii]MEC1356877.1 DUF3298 and DUF4163 domain-containing protein [Bacillus haynesii]MEC1451443.1 DUF3298 and DUF4163 domain-containing protein [Bacillus haynesii]